MTRMLFLDAKTLFVERNGALVPTTLEEAFTAHVPSEPLDVAVFGGDMFKVDSPPERLDARVREHLRPGSIYCTEKLHATRCQVFAIESALLAAIRRHSRQGVVAPYAIALREAIVANAGPGAAAAASGSHGSSAAAADGELSDTRVVLETFGEARGLTVIAGKEILATRKLSSQSDVATEVLRTLRAANVTGGRIVTTDASMASLGTTIGWPVDLIESAEAIGFRGLGMVGSCRFMLPAEIAAARRRTMRRARVFELIAAVGLLALAGLVFLSLVGRNLALQWQLGRAEGQLAMTKANVERVFQKKYAALIDRENQSVAHLWVDLYFGLPSQLAVVEVSADGNGRRAELKHREEVDSTPLGRHDVEAMLAAIPSWKGSRVQESFRSNTITFVVERSR